MKKVWSSAFLFFVSFISFSQLWETFESYTTQAEADANWTSSDVTNMRVDIANNHLNFFGSRVDADRNITYDLGFNANNTQWVLRFQLELTNINPSGSSVVGVIIGLFDQDENSDGQSSHDAMGLLLHSSAAADRYIILDADNSKVAPHTNGDGIHPRGMAIETVGVEIIRTSATTYTLELFDAAFVTSHGLLNGTCPSTIDNLRFIGIKNDSHGGTSPPVGNIDGNIDNVQFCDGTTIFNCDPTPLPIELLSFSAKWQDETYNAAVIEWQTANEINNDYFEVERSLDAINFDPIMQVDGTNSTELTDYLELDTDPYQEGVSYYRLKQVDNDGAFSYSQIEALNVPNGIDIINLYPNPVKDILNFSILSSLNGEIEIRISNSLGQSILTQSKLVLEGVTPISFDLPNIGDGNYYLEIALTSREYKAQQKFIVNQNK